MMRATAIMTARSLPLATRAARLVGLIGIALLCATPARALPTMIRLGYTNCAACHINPQGGGPLNEYGRGIDQAQSLRGGEYQPIEREWLKLVNLDVNGRVTQDLRAVFQDQGTFASHETTTNVFRPRLMYRNATDLSHGFRISGTITADGELTPRPTLTYDPATRASTFFVNSALVSYRPVEGFEIAAGRDQLPSGVNVPDLSFYIKSRNRLGYYDAPAQVKMFWWGKHYQITPFAYTRAGNEVQGEAEHGAGTLAEVDISGHQRAIIGVTALRGKATNGDRRLVGGYARLGFGKWGILAEHDVTQRTRDALDDTTPPTTDARFRQQATYGQLFWAMREWLVLSGIGERLRVEQPFASRLNAGRLELAARLASQFTIISGARVEKNQLTGRLAKSVSVQLAFKTVP